MNDSSKFSFQLFVAGSGLNSENAKANLTRFCKQHLQDQYNLEIIDVFSNPASAMENGVFLTPTLMILSSNPTKCIIGDLSDTHTLFHVLGLSPSGP